MGSASTRLSDDVEEKIDEMVESGKFDSKSEALRHFVEYTLHNKYGLI